MAATSAAAKWARRVERLERSGLSVRRFAAWEGLKAGSLSFWKWKLGPKRSRQGEPAPDAPMKFIELTTKPVVRSAATPPAFEVQLRSGRRVRVEAGFDAVELSRLVAILIVAPTFGPGPPSAYCLRRRPSSSRIISRTTRMAFIIAHSLLAPTRPVFPFTS